MTCRAITREKKGNKRNYWSFYVIPSNSKTEKLKLHGKNVHFDKLFRCASLLRRFEISFSQLIYVYVNDISGCHVYFSGTPGNAHKNCTWGMLSCSVPTQVTFPSSSVTGDPEAWSWYGSTVNNKGPWDSSAKETTNFACIVKSCHLKRLKLSLAECLKFVSGFSFLKKTGKDLPQLTYSEGENWRLVRVHLAADRLFYDQ